MVTDTVDPRVLARDAVYRLADLQGADGNLRDSASGTALPPHSYAVSLLAAACALLADDRRLRDVGIRAVRYYMDLPLRARGAHELNNLGLLCVYREWQRRGIGTDILGLLARHLRRMSFVSTTGKATMGKATNNWHAMRAVCLAQRGNLFNQPEDRRAALACLHKQVLPLQGADDLFADYPPGASEENRATPLTYHAKFCAMLAMFVREIHDDDALSALRRGVRVLACLCAPDGQALYFGRSCNSLYGYAAALYALGHALHMGGLADDERALAARASARMTDFLLRMRQPDGSLRAYPTPPGDDRLGWDDYVHTLDYNAFAAFMLLQLAEKPRTLLGDIELPAIRLGTSEGALIARESHGVYAAFSVRGQIHTGSYLFVDARYSGMQVLTLQDNGRTIVPPAPHDPSAPHDISWIGYMPVITHAGQSWAARTYETVRVIDGEFYTALLGRGRPVALRTSPTHRATATLRHHRIGLVGNLIAPARRLSSWLRIATPSYRMVTLPDVQVMRAIILLPHQRCLLLVDRVDGSFDSGRSTLRLGAPCYDDGGKARFQIGDLAGTVYSVSPPCLQEGGRRVHTSNGPAYILHAPLRSGTPNIAAICFGPDDPWRFDCREEHGRIILTMRSGRASLLLGIDLDGLQVLGG